MKQHLIVLSSFRLLLLLTAGCFLSACWHDATIPKPKNFLSPEIMVDILSEIHLLEAQMGRSSIKNADSSQVIFDEAQYRIFKRFQTDTTTYFASYRYYVAEPQELKNIYEKVVARLAEQEEKSKPMPVPILIALTDVLPKLSNLKTTWLLPYGASKSKALRLKNSIPADTLTDFRKKTPPIPSRNL